MANLKFRVSFPNHTFARKARAVEVIQKHIHRPFELELDEDGNWVSVLSSSKGVGPKTLNKLTLALLIALKKV